MHTQETILTCIFYLIYSCWVSISGVGTVWGYGAPVFAMFVVSSYFGLNN